MADVVSASRPAISFIAGGRIVAEGTALELKQRVANGTPAEAITMEDVFMKLTGKDIAEDERPVEAYA